MKGEDREVVCEPVTGPAAMLADLEGYWWARLNVGESGGAVYRLHGKRDAPDMFLKQGRGSVADDITNEMVRLRWLANHVSVPSVVHFARTPEQASLLMTALPGRTAYQILSADAGDGGKVVDALATFLRSLHAISVDACPFKSDHGFRLRHARARIDTNLVDLDDFDKQREGSTAEAIWTEMTALLPLPFDAVVTHGDFSLDNLLIDHDKVVGCIDVGRAGIADRYQDLAILWNCLSEFGEALQARWFRQYGIEHPDLGRLHFHLLLDELF